MNPSFIVRRAQGLINYKHAVGDTVCQEWLVSVLEKMNGATAHQADQAAAAALASPETTKAVERAKMREHYRNNPADFAAALRSMADKYESGELP